MFTTFKKLFCTILLYLISSTSFADHVIIMFRTKGNNQPATQVRGNIIGNTIIAGFKESIYQNYSSVYGNALSNAERAIPAEITIFKTGFAPSATQSKPYTFKAGYVMLKGKKHSVLYLDKVEGVEGGQLIWANPSSSFINKDEVHLKVFDSSQYFEKKK